MRRFHALIALAAILLLPLPAAAQSILLAQYPPGQTTAAASLPVVLASNQGTLTVAGSGTFTTAGALTNNNAAPGATNVGALVAIANASAPSFTEGRQTLLSVDLSGALRTVCISGCGGGAGGTALTDDAGFTVGSTELTPVGGTYRSTRDAVDDGDAGAFAMNSRRGLYTSPETPNGDSMADDTNDALKVVNATAGNFNATVVGTGTFAVQAAQNGTWNVTNVSGTVSLPTGASTLAEQQTQTTALQLIDDLSLAQASTTSGQRGPLLQAAVTTSAPTYTTAQTNPLSLQTDGSLRTAVTNTVTIASPAVTNAGTFAVQESGAALTALQLIDNLVLAEDQAPAGGDPGVQVLAVRASSPANTSGANGDFEPLQVNAGRLWVDGSGVTLTVANGGTFAVQESGAALTALQLIDNIVSVEDAVAGNAWSGVGLLAVRQDSQAALAADGDFYPVTIASDGGLRVHLENGGSGGTSLADDADFTAGTTSGTPAIGFYQSTVTACTDGDACVVGITAQRALKVTLYNEAGSALTVSTDVTHNAALTADSTAGPAQMFLAKDFDGAALPNVVSAEGDAVLGAASLSGVQYVMLVSEDGSLERGTSTTPLVVGDGSGALNVIIDSGTVTVTDGAGALNVIVDSGTLAVTNAGTFVVQENGAALTALQLIDDVVYTDDTSTHATGTSKGALMMAAATPTDAAVNANDIGALSMTVNRELLVSVATALPAGTNNIGDVDILSIAAGDNDIGNVDLEIAGTAIAVNTGNASAQTLRVVLATDQPALVGLGIYAEDAPETAGGNLSMSGSVRRDTAASSAGTTGDNATVNTDANGLMWVRQMDPCTALNTTTVPISVAADTAVIAAGGASTRTHICGGALVAAAAEIISIWEGTGTACGTSSAALAGSTTEANGMSVAANGGFEISRTIRGIGTNVDVCIRLNGTNRVAGWLSYVQVAQ